MEWSGEKHTISYGTREMICDSSPYIFTYRGALIDYIITCDEVNVIAVTYSLRSLQIILMKAKLCNETPRYIILNDCGKKYIAFDAMLYSRLSDVEIDDSLKPSIRRCIISSDILESSCSVTRILVHNTGSFPICCSVNHERARNTTTRNFREEYGDGTTYGYSKKDLISMLSSCMDVDDLDNIPYIRFQISFIIKKIFDMNKPWSRLLEDNVLVRLSNIIVVLE